MFLLIQKNKPPSGGYIKPHYAVSIPCFDPAKAGGFPPCKITVLVEAERPYKSENP